MYIFEDKPAQVSPLLIKYTSAEVEILMDLPVPLTPYICHLFPWVPNPHLLALPLHCLSAASLLKMPHACCLFAH